MISSMSFICYTSQAILAILFMLLSSLGYCSSVSGELIKEAKKTPVSIISKEQLTGNPSLTVGQIVIASRSGLPFPEMGSDYATVMGQLNTPSNELINMSKELVVVKTNLLDSQGSIQSEFLFENGKLVQGPIIVDFDSFDAELEAIKVE